MWKLLLKFIVSWVVNILAIYIVTVYLGDIIKSANAFDYGKTENLLLLSLIFTVIALLVKPFLKLLSLPFMVFSPILYFVVYGGILLVIHYFGFVPEFQIGETINVLYAGAVITIMNFIVGLVFKK